MFRFVMWTKLALLAAVVLSLLVGQPLYAQTKETPPGTGKTLSAALLGQHQPSVTGRSPLAGQTIRLRIAATTSNSQVGTFVANVEVQHNGQGAGKVNYSDLLYITTSGLVECTPNGAVVILSATRYRNVGGKLVDEGDAHIHVHRAGVGGGGGGDIIVFDIIDSIAKRTIEAQGHLTFSANPCS